MLPRQVALTSCSDTVTRLSIFVVVVVLLVLLVAPIAIVAVYVLLLMVMVAPVRFPVVLLCILRNPMGFWRPCMVRVTRTVVIDSFERWMGGEVNSAERIELLPLFVTS